MKNVTLLTGLLFALGLLAGCSSSEPPPATGPEAQRDQSFDRPTPGVPKGQAPGHENVDMGGRPAAAGG